MASSSFSFFRFHLLFVSLTFLFSFISRAFFLLSPSSSLPPSLPPSCLASFTFLHIVLSIVFFFCTLNPFLVWWLIFCFLHLFYQSLFSIMEKLWIVLLQELKNVVQEVKKPQTKSVQKKSKSTSNLPYQNLYTLLDVLRQIFFANGECLTEQQIQNKEFQVMHLGHAT